MSQNPHSDLPRTDAPTKETLEHEVNQDLAGEGDLQTSKDPQD